MFEISTIYYYYYNMIKIELKHNYMYSRNQIVVFSDISNVVDPDRIILHIIDNLIMTFI